jgi:hypothetical protein
MSTVAALVAVCLALIALAIVIVVTHVGSRETRRPDRAEPPLVDRRRDSY